MSGEARLSHALARGSGSGGNVQDEFTIGIPWAAGVKGQKEKHIYDRRVWGSRGHLHFTQLQPLRVENTMCVIKCEVGIV